MIQETGNIPYERYASNFSQSNPSHQKFLLGLLREVDKLNPSTLQEGGELRNTWRESSKPANEFTAAPSWINVAEKIIKEFEGCVLYGYPDPASSDGKPVTIGWGSTTILGRPVKLGEIITQSQADSQLQVDILAISKQVFSILPGSSEWNENKKGAIVSFAYNIGTGALASSTLKKRLAAGEPAEAVIQQELPRWNKSDAGAVPGLVRRRAAEVQLFLAPVRSVAPAAATQQMKKDSILLSVPYESQLDNSATGWRECFSSSCAMVASFHGKLKGGDKEYIAIRSKYGDTTESNSHVKALTQLGLKASFITNGGPALLESEIRSGRPVAVGWLHRGPIERPSGDGHWSVIVGFDSDSWIMHDPFGEPDMIGGGHLRQNASAAPPKGQAGRQPGQAVRCSRGRFLRRWSPAGALDGWALLVRPGS